MSLYGLSHQQNAIVTAAEDSIAVLACAGSGKTYTCIHRVIELQKRLRDVSRQRVALLSFSNVAVNTFRSDYQRLISMESAHRQSRILISTMDAFITSYVLQPHAFRAMDASKSYLVHGKEQFLQGFRIHNGSIPVEISSVDVEIQAGDVRFFHNQLGNKIYLPTEQTQSVVHRLGRAGAYTHSLGRYWCFRTLIAQPWLAAAIAKRYKYIVIDEAQDIGSAHKAIISILVKAGIKLSLIGDQNQGIYEFAGADGSFIEDIKAWNGVAGYKLTKNYRSVPSIVAVANNVSGRTDEAHREDNGKSGAFFVSYKNGDREKVLDAFKSRLKNDGIDPTKAAVLCRATKMASELSGNVQNNGQGTIKALVQVCVLRDKSQDFHKAFKILAGAVISLLHEPPPELLALVIRSGSQMPAAALRREIWGFLRDSDLGLPSATLKGSSEWHAVTVSRVKELLSRIEAKCGFVRISTLGHRLKSTGLSDDPLMESPDLASETITKIRVDTVHQAKGESIDAILYFADKANVSAFLNGCGTEVGRIGYVAATRARDLLWIAVPETCVKEFRPKLLSIGLCEIAG